jgi:3-dehydroquinate dehydratase-1/3-dehydroquinate dehydratase/shikimate dehydrogenase
MSGRVCVSVTGADAAEIEEALRPVASDVDVVEVRLDTMVRPDVTECCRILRYNLLFTNRPVWEGGGFSGMKQERLAPLLTAVQQQAAYVDLEVRAGIELREQLFAEKRETKSSTRIILSWHDFEATPDSDRLNGVFDQMQSAGADIGKIITTSHNAGDVLRLLSLLETARTSKFPLICFCMGKQGRISRFATLYLGGYMSYVALSEKQATAPGQFPAARFRKLCNLFSHVD